MKKPSFRSYQSISSGFTLVELLVVMGIIAILAGVLLSALGPAIRAAQRAKVASLANGIQTGTLSFYTEYSVYPVAPTATPNSDYQILDTDSVNWKNFLIELCGNIDPTTGTLVAAPVFNTNTRAISFLTLKTSDLLNGAPKNLLPPDTSHLYFNIAIDNNYDGILGGTQAGDTDNLPNFATAVTGSPPQTTGTSTAGVAVWVNCNGNNTTQNPGFWVKTY